MQGRGIFKEAEWGSYQGQFEHCSSFGADGSYRAGGLDRGQSWKLSVLHYMSSQYRMVKVVVGEITKTPLLLVFSTTSYHIGSCLSESSQNNSHV